MKFRFADDEVTHVYATLLGKADEGAVVESVDIDSNLNIYFAGHGNDISNLQAEIDYCSDPATETMPICNSSEQAYMETDLFGLDGERSFLGVINSNFDMAWSTLYGDGNENLSNAIATNEDNLFVVGQSENSWTLEQFDYDNELDYYRNDFLLDYKGDKDGTIARFGINELFDEPIMVNNEISNYSFFISPNPAKSELQIYSSEITFDSMRILNYMGQIVMSKEKPSLPQIIDVSHLESGLYFIEIELNNEKHSKKFIKQ